MIRRPPRSTLDRSSAASDVYKRQELSTTGGTSDGRFIAQVCPEAVSYTHLRAHETGRNLVCRLLLEKKKKNKENDKPTPHTHKRQTQYTATTSPPPPHP